MTVIKLNLDKHSEKKTCTDNRNGLHRDHKHVISLNYTCIIMSCHQCICTLLYHNIVF